jgi:hypothetical protein
MVDNPLMGVSGPSTFSKRTDLPSSYYGEGVETQAIKSGAPLGKTADAVSGPTGRLRQPEAPVTELYAPSQRPDESITAGIDMGEGPGSSALMMQPATEKLSDVLAKMIPYDQTGEIAILYQRAASRGL